jgi:hypothetical protein
MNYFQQKVAQANYFVFMIRFCFISFGSFKENIILTIAKHTSKTQQICSQEVGFIQNQVSSILF